MLPLYHRLLQNRLTKLFSARIIQDQRGLLFTLDSIQCNHFDNEIHCGASCILNLVMLGKEAYKLLTWNEMTFSLTLYKGEVSQFTSVPSATASYLILHKITFLPAHLSIKSVSKLSRAYWNISADLLVTYCKETCSPVLGLWLKLSFWALGNTLSSSSVAYSLTGWVFLWHCGVDNNGISIWLYGHSIIYIAQYLRLNYKLWIQQ